MILSSGRLLYIFAHTVSRMPTPVSVYVLSMLLLLLGCCYCAQLLQIITTAEHSKYIDYVDKVVIIISVDALATLVVWLIDQRLLAIER